MLTARLLEWASPKQAEYLNATMEHGSMRLAATALGVNESTVRNAMKRLRREAAKGGYSEEAGMHHPVPEGYFMERYTQQIGPQGQERIWIKGAMDKERIKALMAEMWTVFAADLPKAPEVPGPKVTSEQLLNLYTFTDYHMGMLAWHREGGDDWDLSIASALLRASFIQMIGRCAPARKCIINIQGDFLHTDGLVPVTPAHKHVLDADSRFRKIALAAVTIIREMVIEALRHHEEVELLICEGNHDESSSAWMQICFQMHFADNPRVKVHDEALPYYAIEHGRTMLAFHHGHKKKNEDLPLLFASSFGEMWGRTRKRYCNTGHRHHYDCKEHAGMYVTQHPTLAARDAHASRGGWMSERAAIGITFHEEFGKWDERWVTPEMVGGLCDGSTK